MTDCCLLIPSCSYLFIMDRTNWRTNILTALLVPYIFLNLPGFLLGIIRYVSFGSSVFLPHIVNNIMLSTLACLRNVVKWK